MSKLTGIKYLKKGLEDANITVEDFCNVSRYRERCTHLLWKIESLLWELDHLKGVTTKFDRLAWDEGRVTLKQALEIVPVTADSVRKYIELMIQSLKEDGDSLTEDLINRKERLGIKSKKILSGYKKI